MDAIEFVEKLLDEADDIQEYLTEHKSDLAKY
jgi:hypothetical protein